MAADARNITRPAAPPQAGPSAGERFFQREQVRRWLLASVDAGLAGLIFLVPLVMGGRTAWGQLVLVSVALWVAVCWCLRQCLASPATWVRSPFTPLLAAALILAGLQLVSLPPPLLGALSPHLYETLPLWAPGADPSTALGVWTTSSLMPPATRQAFVLLSAFALLLLTTVQRVRKLEDVERLLRWIAVATLAMAVFALVQFFTSNGKYFWFFEHPFAETSTAIKGSFTNANHFAQFIALGIGPLIWWVIAGSPRNAPKRPTARNPFGQQIRPFDVKQGLRALGLGCCGFVGLMSLSRGGALVIFVAAVVCTLILYRGALVGRKILLALVGIGLFVGAGLFVYGYDSLMAELDDFGSLQKLDQLEVRRKLWHADLAGIADYPLLGTGLGTHREVFPMYLRDPEAWRNIEYTHAENGYVQVALEAGVPGLLLVLIAIGLCVYWCLRSLGKTADKRVFLCMAAIAASLAASFVHSMWDFVWYVPGCMVVPVILAACACRVCQLTRRDPSSTLRGRSDPLLDVSRMGWLSTAACLVLIGWFMVPNRLEAAGAEPFWHRFLLQHKNSPAPGGTWQRETLQFMARQLSAVVERQPDHARARARLAAIHYELFDGQDSDVGSLGIEELRHAVLASYDPELENAFKSAADARQWLSTALPRQYGHLAATLHHARRALALCPLQGEAYLPLVVFSFIEGSEAELSRRAACTRQALKVRPFDGDVMFTAGVVAVDELRALEEQEQELNKALREGEIGRVEFATNFNELRSRVERSKAHLEESQKRAIAYWQGSFKSGPICQKRLLKYLAGKISAAEFLYVFQPDLPALRLIERHYREQFDGTEELQLVRVHLAEAVENHARGVQGGPAAKYWLEAARTHRQMNRPGERLRCLRNAVRCNSTLYDARLKLAKRLCELQEFGEALTHLNWCLRRKPQDKAVRKLVQDAVQQRLRLSDRPGAGAKQAEFPESRNTI